MNSARSWTPVFFVGVGVMVAIVGVAVATGAGLPNGDEDTVPGLVDGARTVVGTATPTLVPPTGASPTEEMDDFARVSQVLRDDLRSAGLLAGVQFTVLRVFPVTVDGRRVATDAHVELLSAVEGEGPWLSVRCQDTRQFKERVTWTNVTLLRVRVSDSGDLVEFVPAAFNADAEGRILSPPVHHPETASELTVTDLRDGSIVFQTSHVWNEDGDAVGRSSECPPGKEDD